MKVEIWKDVEGYPYEVSNLGNVSRRGKRNLKLGLTQKGYLIANLCSGGAGRCCRVHRLVAEAFIRLLKPREVVHHKDGNRANNKLENLEIISSSALNICRAMAGKTAWWRKIRKIGRYRKSRIRG